MQFELVNHNAIAPGVFRMLLRGDASVVQRPGQFAHVQIPGFYLRRPISICDWSDTSLTLVYKAVGQGTEAMAQMLPGQKLDLLIPLGNGYTVEKGGDKPLLIGGGVGTPPLYGLAKKLLLKGIIPRVLLGFNAASEIFLAEEFRSLGLPVSVATVDGSAGEKGFVTELLPDAASYDFLYACGPEPMLKAVYHVTNCPGQYSFEERMACGIGACMGCTCHTKYGYKRICKDGPVLEREEIVW